MNIKKLVSAVSALAVAGSVFTGLAVTSYAEASVLLSEDFSGESNAFNIAKYTDSEIGDVLKVTSDQGSAEAAIQNGEIAEGEKITVTFDAYHGWVTDGTTFSVSLLNSENKELASYTYTSGSTKITDLKINGVTAAGFVAENLQSRNTTTGNRTGANGFKDLGKLTSQYYVTTDGYNPKFTFEIDGYGGVTVNYKKTSDNIDKTFTGMLSDDTAKNLAKIRVTSTITNDGRNGAIDNLVVTKDESSVIPANYKVKYVCNDVEFQKQKEFTGNTATIPKLSQEAIVLKDDAGKATAKYVYVSDDTATVGAPKGDGSTVYTVKYEQAKAYNALVKSSVGDAEFLNEKIFEGESVEYVYPKYITDENNKVIAKADNDTYAAQVTANAESLDGGSEDTITISVPYSKYEGTAYFVEAEDVIANVSHDSLSNANLSSKDAVRGFNGKDKIVFTVPEDGIYTVTYAALTTNSGANKGGTVALYKNSNEEGNLINSVNVDHISVTYVRTTGTVSKPDYELHKNDKIIVSTTTSAGSLDYVLLEKTAELEAETPEPVSAEHDRDFTTNGDHASVWKATVSGISADDSYTKIVATAESAEKGTGTGSIDLSTEIKGKGSVLVYVVVPADDATSVKVTLE